MKLAGLLVLATITGQATAIDGDTLAMSGYRLQLKGIDAPELGQHCTIRDTCYDCGESSKAFLETLIRGKTVTCRPTGEGSPEGALVHCTAGGRRLDVQMLLSGHALSYPPEASVLQRGAEEAAQERGFGMWRGEFVKPWRWRRPGERTKARE